MTVQDPDQPSTPAPAEAPDAATADKPARRRRSPRKAESMPAPSDESGGDGGEPAAALPAAVPSITADGAEAGHLPSGPAAGDRPAEASGDGMAPRNKRNRRRGRRGRGARDGMEVDGAPLREGAAVPESVATPDAGELFETVISGAFDVEDSEADRAAVDDATALAGAVEAQPAPGETIDPITDAVPKRVLAPEADAPKLHKVLAQSGVGSRRDLEQMIADNRVTVNGETAHTGQRISWGDRVAIDGKPIKVRIAPPPARVIAYHKPVGEVVTHDDPQQRPTVFRKLPRLANGKWQSVGRLDINTEGLLLFTTSGELANQLMHPRFGVEREYAVRVLGTLDPTQRERLLEGVDIEGQRAAFKSIEDGGGEGVNHWYRVVITEGRNREVRRLFDSVGLTVSRLIRIRYGSVVLPRGLKRGACVDLGDEDLRHLRRLTGAGASRGGDARGGQRGTGPRGDGRNARQDRPEGVPAVANDGPGPRDGNSIKRGRRGKRRGGGAEGLFDEGAPPIEGGDDDHVGPIPNPLQQTYDKRAIREASSRRRELSDDSPIPNPLQQTYDKRAMREASAPRREVSDDGPIPNPLQQTYDKRFVQGPQRARGPGGAGGRSGSAGRGGRKGGGGSGGGADGSRQPDPMQTAIGYIGADALLRKKGGGRGGKGGGGPRRGGGGGGGGGGPGRKGR